MDLQQFKCQQTQIWILPITALAFAVRLYGLDTQSLWFDEIITVILARVPWHDGLVGLLGQGIQLTPLFHWIIKLGLFVDDTDWWLRVPAVAVGVLTVPMMFKLGQQFFNDQIGLCAAFIFAINPYQVWYGQEVKLYTLLPLTAAGAMIAFKQMLQTSGRQGVRPLIFFNTLGFAAHYFTFLIPTVQFMYIVVTFKRTHRLLWRWSLAQLIAVLPLVPWWGFIIWQQHFAVGIGWASRPGWYSPILTLWNFSLAYTGEFSIITTLALAAMMVGLVIGLRQAWYQPKRGSLLTLWLFFPPIITILLSFRYISFYVDRYLLIISPVLTVLVVVGLLSIPIKTVKWGVLFIFLVGTIVGLWRVYFDRENFSKEDWRTIAQSIDTQAKPDHMVITCTDGNWLSFEYYNPHQTLSPNRVIFASQVDQVSAADRVVWIVDVHQGLSMHYLSKTQPPVMDRTLLSPEAATWEANNLQGIITVSGISAYQYEITDLQPLASVVEWYCQN